MSTTNGTARWIDALGTDLRSRVVSVLLVGLSLFLLGRTVASIPPLWNWDVLGYMGLALEWEEDDPAEVHRRVYEAAQAELPPQTFLAHTRANEILRARFRDASVYTEHIAFYRARALGTLAISLLHRAGVSLAHAVWYLSLGSFAALALVGFAWLARRTSIGVAAVCAVLLAQAPPLVSTATMATVDGFGSLLVVVGAWLLLERRSFALGAALLTLSIGARPDQLVLVGVLAAFLFLFERGRPERIALRKLALWAVVSVALYAALGAFAQGYGWWPAFQITFGPKVMHPTELPTAVDWGAWWRVLGEQAAGIPNDGYFGPNRATGSMFVFTYVGFALLALALWSRLPSRDATRRHAIFLAALLTAYLVRWFLFPELWDRFFAPLFVLVPLCAVSMAASGVEGLRKDSAVAGE